MFQTYRGIRNFFKKWWLITKFAIRMLGTHCGYSYFDGCVFCVTFSIIIIFSSCLNISLLYWGIQQFLIISLIVFFFFLLLCYLIWLDEFFWFDNDMRVFTFFLRWAEHIFKKIFKFLKWLLQPFFKILKFFFNYFWSGSLERKYFWFTIGVILTLIILQNSLYFVLHKPPDKYTDALIIGYQHVRVPIPELHTLKYFEVFFYTHVGLIVSLFDFLYFWYVRFLDLVAPILAFHKLPLPLIFIPLSFIFFFLQYLFFVLPILITIAYYTLAERKIMASVQRRKGPDIVGFFGVLQPIADGVKLILKEIIVPHKANYLLFLFAPVLSFSLSLFLWVIIPFTYKAGFLDSQYGLLYLFAISSLSIFGVIGAGWSSNSKYAILGSLRSAAQLISYEIALGFVFLTVGLFAESFNILDIIISQKNHSNIFALFPLCFIFFISALAETNRAPFDLPEAEAEIVAGYNVEYSGIKFALFFLGEYSNMLIMSMVTVILFFGSSSVFGIYDIGDLCYYRNINNLSESYFELADLWFSIKVGFIAGIFIIIRAALPRVRYDQLMYLGWQVFLPLTLSFFCFFLSIFFSSDLFFFWDKFDYFDLFFDILN